MKSKILRKILAVSLSAAMVMCTGLTTVGQFVGTDISVSAADTYGDFQYQVNSDGTVTIMEYTGNGGDVAVPGMINGRNVTEIYQYAFHECETLTSVTIPYGVTAVNDFAFINCTSLISVVFPASVTFIGDSVFMNCDSLASILVDKNNPAYSSDQGVLLDKDKTTVILCPKKKKGTYKIPDTVTSVCKYAFSECWDLTSIDIPNGVTHIESYTFSKCGITSIVIPESVASIGYNAFDGCAFLKDITFPKNLEMTSNNAFQGTAWYNSQPNGLVYAGSVLYKYKGSMPENAVITVKDGTVAIGGSALSSQPNLKSVILPDTIKAIGECAFEYSSNLNTVNIPEGVVLLDHEAFYNCKNITNITLPDSLTEIGTRCFERTGLKSLIIPKNVTNIGYYTFQDCQNLTSIVLPDGIKEIGRCVFEGCIRLEDINIPNSVKVIISGAFSGCTALQSITVPDSVTSVYSSVFENCTALTSVTLPESLTSISWGVFSNCPNLTIYGMKGSHAETYAKRNNIPFVSAISSDEIVLGGTVTVNAKAVNCTSNYTYAVLYKKKSESKWTVKQNYSKNDTVIIKPAKATDYDICIKVKDSTGKITKKFFELKVNEKLKNTSVISSATIKKGSTVTVKGSATGGMGSYQYAVLYKKKSESKWTVRQGYKDNSEIIVRPYTNTDYDICIKVQDKDGTIAKKYFSVTVK